MIELVTVTLHKTFSKGVFRSVHEVVSHTKNDIRYDTNIWKIIIPSKPDQIGADFTTFFILRYNMQHPNGCNYCQTERFIGLLTNCTTEKAILTFCHYNI